MIKAFLAWLRRVREVRDQRKYNTGVAYATRRLCDARNAEARRQVAIDLENEADAGFIFDGDNPFDRGVVDTVRGYMHRQ